MRIERIIWRNKEGTRDLLTFERSTGKITAPAFELTPVELLQLRHAADECLLEMPAESCAPEHTPGHERRPA